MCAIIGVLKKIDDGTFKKALDSLRHRGEDSQRILSTPFGKFGFNRLAIEGITSDLQPFYKIGTIVMFNGEIYNYKELIKRFGLEATSEVEVLYALWKKTGVDFVKYLDGMFAIAIYDKKLYLFCDEFGKKPLYFTKDGVFASEIRGVLPFVKKELNYEALSEYLAYNAPLSPNTIYSGVYKLPPGCYYDGEIKRWFDFKREVINISEIEAQKRVEELLIKSVDKRLMGEVEIGALLSGGIDSSLIASIMSKSRKIKTFSIGYDGYENYDERKYAKITASYINSDHYEVNLTKKEFFENFDKVLEAMDYPIADSSFFAVYKLASQIPLKVVLSGEGSDELFLGYRRYNEFLGFFDSYLPNKKWLEKYLNRYPEDIKEWEIFRRFFADETVFRGINETFFQKQINKALKKKAFKVNYEKYVKDWREFALTYFDLKVWIGEVLLMKLDKMFMAWGIEARSPFLDKKLCDFVFSLPQEIRGKNKTLLKNIASKYIPSQIIKRRKKGFALPFLEWLKEENELGYIIDINRKTKIFNEEYLKEIIKTGHKRYKQHLWTLYLFSRFIEKEFL